MRARSYWVFYNLVRPTLNFMCNETLTYSTHGDLEYLKVLDPLIKRWHGPVSMAMYAPADDYERTLKAIFYYR